MEKRFYISNNNGGYYAEELPETRLVDETVFMLYKKRQKVGSIFRNDYEWRVVYDKDKPISVLIRDYNLEEFSNSIRCLGGSKCSETEQGFIMSHKVKYGSALTFVVNSKRYMPKWIYNKELKYHKNSWLNGSEIIFGNYFISKKGNVCFELTEKENSKHVIIKRSHKGYVDDFEAKFKNVLPEGIIYTKFSKSNGGGIGYSFVVLSVENFEKIYN